VVYIPCEREPCWQESVSLVSLTAIRFDCEKLSKPPVALSVRAIAVEHVRPLGELLVTHYKRLILVIVCTLAAFGFSANLKTVQAETPAFTKVEIDSAIRKGVELERSAEWIDAIQLYEKASKNWPETREFQYGLRRAKVNFSIDRRYADRSFEEKLLQKPYLELLGYFDDVLRLVHNQYVDRISFTSFVAHGTECFYLALSNRKFNRKHLANVDKNRISQIRMLLRDVYWNKPVRNSADARRQVEAIAEKASSILGISKSAVVLEYLFGGCHALDDYSNFLTPNRLTDLYGNIDGGFVGLGIEMKAEKGKGLFLANILPNSPAIEGGLRRGDYIEAIDGVDCRNMTTDEASKYLRGPVLSYVKLTFTHPAIGQTRTRMFVRREVTVQSIPEAKILDRRFGIGYIQMTGFQKTSAAELDQALAKLQRQGMRAVIWDLRSNPGGLLTSAVEVLDRFVEKGILVSTKGRNRDQNWTYSARQLGTTKIPLVLLVDGDSASASEIVAGAIRDLHRGTIVGRKTFGKWSVQTILPVRGKTGLKLTTAKFYSPKGFNLSKIGVKPDIVVKRDKKDLSTFYRAGGDMDWSKDADIAKALETLRKKISSP